MSCIRVLFLLVMLLLMGFHYSSPNIPINESLETIVSLSSEMKPKKGNNSRTYPRCLWGGTIFISF